MSVGPFGVAVGVGLGLGAKSGVGETVGVGVGDELCAKTLRGGRIQPATIRSSKQNAAVTARTLSIFALIRRTLRGCRVRHSGWPCRFAPFLEQCDNRAMRKLLIVVRTMLAAGVVLLGNAVAQTSAAPSPTPPAKKSAGSAAKKSPSAATKTGTASKAQPVTALTTTKQKASYAIGMNWGTGLHRQSIDVDTPALLQGMKDALAGGKTLLTEDEARTALMQLQKEMQEKQQAKAAQEGDANKKEGDAFLAANKTKEGVKTLPSGLQYKILKEGNGPKPTASDSVVCNYKGTLINGTEFDSSYKRGEPATFPVTGVIKGWTEALQLMSVGSKWQLFIPPDLAYGPRGTPGGPIGPNATLIFEVELVSIKDKNPPPDKAPAPGAAPDKSPAGAATSSPTPAASPASSPTPSPTPKK
jgi:FKBP-type peptidyl-prolyl cis-trans isomerase FklB